MRILVTSGAGFIGRHLVKSLLVLNAKVIVIDNLLSQVHHGDGEFGGANDAEQQTGCMG